MPDKYCCAFQIFYDVIDLKSLRIFKNPVHFCHFWNFIAYLRKYFACFAFADHLKCTTAWLKQAYQEMKERETVANL